MPAATLNQFRCELRRPRAVLVGERFTRLVELLRFVGLFRPVQQFNLLASTTFAVRNASSSFFMVLGLSFYPFGAGLLTR